MGTKEKYINLKCPCKNCGTPFKGSMLQIAHNFKTHYEGAHIKKGEHGDFDDIKKEEFTKVITEKVFNEIISSFEPEVTQDDEYLNSLNVKDENERNNFDLIYYLGETPVCREERQFALYFANKLEMQCPEIKELLTISGVLGSCDTIEKVFFEVTLLRDYFFHKVADEKIKFNQRLKEFVTNENSYEEEVIKHNHDKLIKTINAYNIDNKGNDNELAHANHWKKPHHIAKWMMNAKPDIGLVIKSNDEYKLTFIECKYESNVDYYKNQDLPEGMKQLDLQRLILKFLCDANYIGAKYNGNPLVKGSVHLVKFFSDKDPKKNNKDNEIRIPIKTLLCQQL